MSRLYLVVVFIVVGICSGIAQNKIKKIISFADEQYKKGDYYYALEYYKKALEKDSNSIELLWKYAETNRGYKNYIDAEKYYGKVYAREQTKKYPNSLLNLGLMQKQNGNYEQAIKTFELSLKKLSNKSGTYYYKKSQREVESTKWALKNRGSTSDSLVHLPLTVNSYDAEFPHAIMDNKLVFSSLKADSLNQDEEVYGKSYKTKIYYSEFDSLGVLQPFELNQDLFDENYNYGNGTFSSDASKFYYSICEDNGFGYICNIVVASYIDGTFNITDTLGPEVNQKGKNTTMPKISSIDGVEYLFFTSNRNGGLGGLDIWMAESIDGIQFKSAVNIKSVNSAENEITPWFDTKNNQLYFSSPWHNGFGGQDIHYSIYIDGVFSSPINALEPLNSSANDMYYFGHNDTTFLSSNRVGGYYSKNPTCCSDIYASYPIIELITDTIIEDTIIIEEIITEILPITLYFRNDEPDASTLRKTTKQNYINTYNLYVEKYDYYKTEVAKGLSEGEGKKLVSELDGFFVNDVDKGAKDLDLFKTLVLEELEAGSEVSIFVRGFASPVAKTSYNVNLTQRRISSLINYFNEVDDGVFRKYMNNSPGEKGKLNYSIAPFGEYAANQNTSDDVVIQNESVFSKAAGIERKIEIESMTIKRDKTVFPLSSNSLVNTLKERKSGEVISAVFEITNQSRDQIKLILSNEDNAIKLKANHLTLQPNQSALITALFDTKNLTGHQSRSFEALAEGYEGKISFFINTELK